MTVIMTGGIVMYMYTWVMVGLYPVCVVHCTFGAEEHYFVSQRALRYISEMTIKLYLA